MTDPVTAATARRSAEAAIAMDRVSFGYQTRPILDDVTLTIPAGKVVAVMGGSGVGKTTLLRLIGGQVRPQSGSVHVLRQSVPDLKREPLYALRRRIGMLFQFGALFTDLSVFDNVAFPLREHSGLEETMIRDMVLMKLESVGLRGAASLLPSQISGGMARRVALARAIALDPEVILYDEPFAGLDPISLGITANLIRRLNDALGAASVIVTHDVSESFAIADEVYVLAPGDKGARVIAHGTPQELHASKDPFLVQFLNGRSDGPVRFHYPAPPIAQDLGITMSDRTGGGR